MTKTAKFLLCENPIADKSDGKCYILHNRGVKLFAEVYAFEDAAESEIMDLMRQFECVGKLDYGIETFVFGCLWLLHDAKFIAMDKQAQADELAGIMRRMADWYESYLIWEDSQHGD